MRRTRFSALILATILGTSTTLSGCIPLLIGASMAGATVVATDRRTTGMQVEDERIEQVFAQQARAYLKNDVRVSATSYNRVVLLTGEVRSAQEKALATQLASGVQNVRTVVNELEVVPMISSIGQRSQDTMITSQVKSSLVAASDVTAQAVKVVTEMNIVYLMGLVTPTEARRAAEIARGINGVRKVVRVFEGISDDDLKTGAYLNRPQNQLPTVVHKPDNAIQPVK